MICRVSDLQYKEVINVRDGSSLGNVSDVEVDTVTAKISALIIYGRRRLFGLFLRGDDVIIRWCDIEMIGADAILVNMRPEFREHRKKNPGVLGRLFS